MNIKTKFLTKIAPFIPISIKIKALYKKALNYYIALDGAKTQDKINLFEFSPEERAQKEIKRIIKQKQVNKLFLVLIKNS